ncbi:unnamed protein product [Pleuronectes platessa]|uniref:Uncharacterized protein n=1 Tax=Pleuronectes platessa TaxID=8262 RepID=A0A9N7VRQ7_PLEPL|nr:unnamed protein product [Pleuronectes platessa]
MHKATQVVRVEALEVWKCYRSITSHWERGLPGKRPHGNRIRAWGLSASRSAPISQRVSSSLDGVRATGELTSAEWWCGLRSIRTELNRRESARRSVFLPPGLQRREKCGN